MKYSKKAMLEELMLAIHHHLAFSCDIYASTNLPLDITKEMDAKEYSHTRIWHLMSFIYDYVANQEWDTSNPIVNQDSGWICDTDPVVIAHAFIRSIDVYENALPLLDAQGDAASLSVCKDLMAEAIARRKIDLAGSSDSAYFPQNDLTAQELSILASVSYQSVKNALTKQELQGTAYSIEPEEAKRWLESKSGYTQTRMVNYLNDLSPRDITSSKEFHRWMKEAAEENGVSPDTLNELTGLDLDQLIQRGEDYLSKPIDNWFKLAELLDVHPKWLIYTFLNCNYANSSEFLISAMCMFEGDLDTPSEMIPTAKDGSSFLPYCRSKNGYRIGQKGDEVLIADYWEALKELKEMPVPRWRRPSTTTGIPGIVTGIAEKEFLLADINEMLSEYQP